ncbi:hypothetical protein H6P81_007686 [Aristolochia fimbriata]|uniref:SAC3/GANP/THP3 conserved domain-containing protein n=1 Tax=Aristolochia fimbriata TaxID=158543 RepID=A0AAV7F4A1_ARIFI|nr:hypothetical protein H6P81_007686 [Aristolochia fimbriata]
MSRRDHRRAAVPSHSLRGGNGSKSLRRSVFHSSHFISLFDEQGTEGGGLSRPSTPSSGQSCYVVSSFNEKDSEEGELHNFTALVGTCLDMCPAAERARRERLKDLAIFERLNGDNRKTSSNLAVKKFCRTITSESIQASDIRPQLVLKTTLKYLMDFLDSSVYPYEMIHDFVFDRTRSIRQDITVQNIKNNDAIHMYEDMVKFYVLSHNKLAKCRNNSNIMSLLCLNKEQLVKSLVSLYGLYKINDTSIIIRTKAAEFYSLYILLQLGLNRQTMGESITSWLRQLPPLVLKSKELDFARSILRYVKIGNYVRFFRTIAAEASNLQFCLIEPYINEVRVLALSFINHSGYKPHPYPLARLSAILMMQESEVESLCLACALQPKTDEAGVKVFPTKQTSFCRPTKGFQHYSFSGSERKSTRFSDL